MFKYTLIFIVKSTRILMLNRNAAPLMGKWNGIGGKIDEGETPLEGVIRVLVPLQP